MNVILIHGKDTNPSEKWYPWLIEELKKKDLKIQAPALPKPNDPAIEEWVDKIEKLNPNKKSILIGHSRGAGAILKWLEGLEENKKVRKVILVAGISGHMDDRHIPSETNFGFYTKEGFDYNKIKKHCDDFVVIHSRDDEWVPFRSGERNAKGLDAKFLIFDDKNHFGWKTTPEFPELLEEIIK